MVDSKKSVSSKHHRTDEHMNSQETVVTCTRPACTGSIQKGSQRNKQTPTPSQEAASSWCPGAKEISALSYAVSQDILTTLQGKPYPMHRSSWLTQNKLYDTFVIFFLSFFLSCQPFTCLFQFLVCVSVCVCFVLLYFFKERGKWLDCGGTLL